MARHDFLLDVSLALDRRIAAVFAGSPVEAHAAGVRFVSQVMLEKLDEPVDAVITTSAGYPLDLTYYQSLKGVTAAQHIVKPGGRILLVAACQEGPGGGEFRQMLRDYPSDRQFMNAIEKAPVVVDQWQLEKLALVTERMQVLFYVPGLPAEYYPTLWGPVYSSAGDAVRALFDGLPAGASVAIIPEGPYVLAKTAAGVGTAA
jgi:nickel-dependent lactate racemase